MPPVIDGPAAGAGMNFAFNAFSIALTTSGLIRQNLGNADQLTRLSQHIVMPGVQLGGEAA
jgi:hypothetical protein